MKFTQENTENINFTQDDEALKAIKERKEQIEALVKNMNDDDLLNMNDDDYMNQIQLEYFKKKLTDIKINLLNNFNETSEHLREDNAIISDPADRATLEEEHAIELQTRERERKLLKKINYALELIKTGKYGYCEETGEKIGLPRLLARPTATLCLEAQLYHERLQKIYGE